MEAGSRGNASATCGAPSTLQEPADPDPLVAPIQPQDPSEAGNLEVDQSAENGVSPKSWKQPPSACPLSSRGAGEVPLSSAGNTHQGQAAGQFNPDREHEEPLKFQEQQQQEQQQQEQQQQEQQQQEQQQIQIAQQLSKEKNQSQAGQLYSNKKKWKRPKGGGCSVGVVEVWTVMGAGTRSVARERLAVFRLEDPRVGLKAEA